MGSRVCKNVINDIKGKFCHETKILSEIVR